MAGILRSNEAYLLDMALEFTAVVAQYQDLLRPAWRDYFRRQLAAEGILVEQGEQEERICRDHRFIVEGTLGVLWRSARLLNDIILSFEHSDVGNERNLFRRLERYGASGGLGREVDADFACVGLLALRCMEELLADYESGHETPPSTVCFG